MCHQNTYIYTTCSCRHTADPVHCAHAPSHTNATCPAFRSREILITNRGGSICTRCLVALLGACVWVLEHGPRDTGGD